MILSLKKNKGMTFLSPPVFRRKKPLLFLSVLVSLIEHINTTGGIDDFGLTGVERMRCIGNLDLYERIFNALDNDGLLGRSAGAGDEYVLV